MDLLLDVNVVVDICTQRRPHFEAARDAVAACQAAGGRIWLYVGSVQTLEYVTRAELSRQLAEENVFPSQRQLFQRTIELLHEFAKDKQWLAALAEEGSVFDSEDPEDEQLIRALRRFGEGKIKILTRDADLIEKCAQAITPEES